MSCCAFFSSSAAILRDSAKLAISCASFSWAPSDKSVSMYFFLSHVFVNSIAALKSFATFFS